MNNTMEVNGLTAILNTPEALKGEGLNALPPHDPRPAYPVDEYPGCPKNWMHGSAKASSYFVPVEAGRGMWFDFTRNQYHKHHVAVVVSVQGVNPVTGQHITALNMEQYKNQCPLHKVDFQQDRFCPKCKYKWPAQNYISTTTGQPLWIDGFRNDKGEVRQYIITEEEASGVAAQLIGEDRVFAIGFAFYLSKEPKPEPKVRAACSSFGFNAMPCAAPGGKGMKSSSVKYKSMKGAGCQSAMLRTASLESLGYERGMDADMAFDDAEAQLEVGAGARIDQDFGVDPEAISFWQDEPAGLIYVNYVPEKIAQKILKAGKREEAKDGFLTGLKVGNKK